MCIHNTINMGVWLCYIVLRSGSVTGAGGKCDLAPEDDEDRRG